MTPDKKQVIDRLKEATNILVTVNSNPTIDQLAACLGLTLALNKAGKHATAVFSGEVPSTLEFLQPDQTLEKTTDSLRDFIISLDKAKADKLRYKVEDNVVKIFITPYRTAITEDDFEYSQGDFNVEVVIALGVKNPQDLDQAIISHGRILHDATVASINCEPGTELGTLNITDVEASSLSEIVSTIVQNLDAELLDNQIATALLTGIVAETERFSNEKTTPTTMSVSSSLMAAGANQQLVATQLQKPVLSEDSTVPVIEKNSLNETADVKPVTENKASVPKPKEPGVLEISHDSSGQPGQAEPELEQDAPNSQIAVDENGQMTSLDTAPKDSAEPTSAKPGRMVLQPPTLQGSQFTANTSPDTGVDTAATEDISLPAVDVNNLTHNETDAQAAMPASKPFNLDELLSGESTAVSKDNETLADLEKELNSPHAVNNTEAVTDYIQADDALNADRDLNDARHAVEDAVAGLSSSDETPLQAVEALNALPVDLNPPVFSEASPVVADPISAVPSQLSSAPFETMPTESAADQPLSMPMPPSQPTQSPLFSQPAAPVTDPQSAFAPPAPQPQFAQQQANPNAPPPVPPPMMPPSFGQPQ